jgi:hypothetical protein
MPDAIAAAKHLPGRRDALVALARGLAEAGRRRTKARMRTDLAAYAAECLMIRTKSGEVLPLVLNRAQRHIHAQLEAQRAATGKVRALILKGRQQGCSTYVGGRFFHRVTHDRGMRVFILTHEDAATRNLFEMVERFHDHCPPDEKQSTGAANARELFFDALDSGYTIGTAGTKGVGRSSTIQLFHGSEVAFWPHAETHAAGILQAVPDIAGTEVILESTANGLGNYFHQTWRDAETGDNDFVAIFVPWFWQDEYRRTPPRGFAPSAEEREYRDLYGLDDAQICWRRQKVAELKDAGLFKQEYPANAAEAFQESGHDSFIPPSLVARARKAKCEPSGPLVIGYDPAWIGEDRHAMAWRRGRKVEKVETRLRPAQPPRRDVDEVARVARGSRRRADPRPRRAAGRRVRAGLHLRLQLAAQARGEGPHARAWAQIARRMGRGGADLRRAGGGRGGVRAEAGVSGGRGGVVALPAPTRLDLLLPIVGTSAGAVAARCRAHAGARHAGPRQGA